MDLLRQIEIIETEEFLESEEKEQFRITDLNQCNWAFRKLQALKKEKEEINNLAQAETFRNIQDSDLAGKRK